MLTQTMDGQTAVGDRNGPDAFPAQDKRANAHTSIRPVRTLSRWPTPRDNEFLVVPVGGLGRIGMNWTLYGHAGRWLLVDAGIAFPEERGKGVDAIVPDPASLKHVLDRVEGLVVTHAHEDHIGAVDRIWPGMADCPIHATPFAAALLTRRFEEAGTLPDVDLRVFEVGDTLELGPFSVQTIAVTHSVPEPVALAITTAAGTILHTGDFKLDATPLLGQPTDLAAISALGDRGLLAMVCDSTNADRELPESSEAQVLEAFRRIFARQQGAVVVCCFASNVARMASACIAADAAGRSIGLAGRSMRTNEAVASELGMLDGVPQPLSDSALLRELHKSNVALICTGGQGEERAALARLARGDWRLPKLGPGDAVVMSGRIIPGNEAEAEAVLSRLRARGVTIIEGRSLIDGVHPVHVSGHAGARELRTMHLAARPRFALPVHGEPQHLAAHAQIALGCGAETAHIGAEGDVLSVSQAGMKTLGRVRIRMRHLENDEQGNRIPLSGAFSKRGIDVQHAGLRP